jgi:hypothetical protein
LSTQKWPIYRDDLVNLHGDGKNVQSQM